MSVQIQRPLRGSRISSFYPIKNLPSLASLDSAFQLQEYISLLIRLDVHDVNAIVSLPGKEKDKDREKDTGKEKHPEDDGTGAEDEKSTDEKDRKAGEITVDEACWIYEQLRYCTYVHSQALAHVYGNSGVSHRTCRIRLSRRCSKNAHARHVPK